MGKPIAKIKLILLLRYLAIHSILNGLPENIRLTNLKTILICCSTKWIRYVWWYIITYSNWYSLVLLWLIIFEIYYRPCVEGRLGVGTTASIKRYWVGLTGNCKTEYAMYLADSERSFHWANVLLIFDCSKAIGTIQEPHRRSLKTSDDGLPGKANKERNWRLLVQAVTNSLNNV